MAEKKKKGIWTDLNQDLSPDEEYDRPKNPLAGYDFEEMAYGDSIKKEKPSGEADPFKKLDG